VRLCGSDDDRRDAAVQANTVSTRRTTPPSRAKTAKDSTPHDVETHGRLLESASRLFADRGFAKVTVREICRDAEANLAAVSYHFRDKLGLYMAVVNGALETIRKANDATMEVPPDLPPAERIRHYIHNYLPRIVRAEGRVERIQKIMRHEMAEPTPAVRMIVEQLIEPRIAFLCAAVGELIGCPRSDRRVSACVMSIQSQCLFYAPDRFKSAAFPGWPPTDDASIVLAADHITEFSLAGIRNLAGPTARRQGARRRMRRD
jgi:AcrR family transcriptional regulator